jgi:two-component system, cell cycle sensor histidine kinase and response regulator CckA
LRQGLVYGCHPHRGDCPGVLSGRSIFLFNLIGVTKRGRTLYLFGTAVLLLSFRLFYVLWGRVPVKPGASDMPSGWIEPAFLSVAILALAACALLVPVSVRRGEEQTRVQENPRDTDRLLAAVFAASPVGFCLLNGDTIQWVSRALCDMLAYGMEELKGRDIAGLYSEEGEHERVKGQLLNRDHPSGGSRAATRWIRGNGSTMHCLLQAAPTRTHPLDEGFILAVMDTSELKHKEEALLESEERYRKFFEEDLTAAYVSTADGRLLSCNPAFVRIFGFPSVEAAITSDLSFLQPKSDSRSSIVELIKKHKKIENHRFVLSRCDGKKVHVVMNAVGTFNRQGDMTLLKGYLLDVTDQKNLEEELRQAQKMEAVGRLAGGIAHDFNNLLTAITGYADALEASLKGEDALRRNAEEIKRAAERAAALTNQLLAFSRKQVLRPRVLDLREVITHLEAMLRRLIGEDVELCTEIDDGLWRVKADRGQIEQVLLNLTVNARDAMPRGGRLVIEASNAELDGNYASHHMAVSPGSYVQLAVSDNGMGMTKEVLSHLFEPFYTTKEQGKGTGLGLATVYGIVTQSGGHVWVYSEPGGGTTFKIYLPRAEGEVEEQLPVIQEAIPIDGTETILLVEDDDMVRNMICETLKQHGYIMLSAANGGEALKLCDECDGAIDLLVSDVVMPGMNGRELAEVLAESFPQMKTLFISGYTDQGIVHNGILDPETDFLQKPFRLETLGRKIRQILDS